MSDEIVSMRLDNKITGTDLEGELIGEETSYEVRRITWGANKPRLAKERWHRDSCAYQRANWPKRVVRGRLPTEADSSSIVG